MKTKILIVLSLLALQCSFAKTIMTVDPVAPTLSPLKYCDPNNDGFGVFDFADLNYVILGAQSNAASNYVVEYYENLTNAQTDANPISSPYYNINPWSQTIYYRVTNINTSAFVVGSLQLVVNPTPVATTPADISLCDNYNDGIEAFDFTPLIPQILGSNNPSTTTVAFYESQLNANLGSSPIAPINNYTAANGTIIWARVTFNATGCHTVVNFHLYADPIPTTPTVLPSIAVCDMDSNPQNGITAVDLTQQTAAILALQPSAALNYTVTYYSTMFAAQSGTSPILNPNNYIGSNGESIWVRIQNSTTGCYAIGGFSLVINAPAFATGPQNYSSCDNYSDPSDGIGAVNLTQYAPAILNGQNPAVFLLSYYTSLADAIAGVNALPLVQASWYVTNPNTDTIWVKVENSSNSITPLCYALTTININVTPYPNPIITTTNNLNTVYVDASHNVVQPLLLDSGVTGNYTYQWYLNGSLIAGATNSIYLVNSATPNNESRTYSVSVESNNALACSGSSVTFLVLQSNDVPPPIGSNSQSFAPGATLANIVVSGSNVQWYASATNKMTTSTPLPLNTPLVDGTTYYASQTVGGIESIVRLPVTVHLALRVNENEIFPIRYAPNPVKDNLTLQSSVVLKSVLVYTMLGQKILEQNVDSSSITIDLSRLSTGNYIVKVQGDTGQKTLRIIKE